MPASYLQSVRRRLTVQHLFTHFPFFSLLRRGFPIMLATLLSRPLGYLRVALQAWLFGASAAMDAFVVAFAVPSILQVVLLSGPLSGVLVPTFTPYRHDRQALNALFDSIFTWCLLVSIAIGSLAAFLAPMLMYLSAPGMTAEVHALATLLFRLMLPMLITQALLSICKGTLNSLDHYGAPEYAGAVFNVVMIAVTLVLHASLGIVGLALGASLGSFAQLLMQFPFLARYGVTYRLRLHGPVRLRQLLTLASGAFLSTITLPVISLIDRALASTLFPGAVSALNYAFMLFLLPVSLCVVPLSTVSLTDLASLYHQGQVAMLRRRSRSTLCLALLLTLPVALVGTYYATPLTRLVYEYGRFQTTDTQWTATAVQAYLLGLPCYAGVHLLSRSFYAMQDTMTPAVVGLVMLGLNVVGDYLLMQLFGHWGIALARTVTLCVTAVVLYLLFERRCRLATLGGVSLDRPERVQ